MILQLCSMWRKLFFLIFLLIVKQFVAQVTNSEIRYVSDNTLLLDNINYCPGENFNLKVNASATSTGDYDVTKEYASLFPLAAGINPIVFDNATAHPNNNKFSQRIAIGFPFSFYGKTYNYLSVGINGRLVFNDDFTDEMFDRSKYIDRTFTGDYMSQPLTKLPSPNYNKVDYVDPNREIELGQIFFGYTDLSTTPGVATLRTYKYVMHDGLKGLLISFQYAVYYDYAGSFNASVLLLEDGRIIIYINGKTRTSINTILGIQNEKGTLFKPVEHSTKAYDYNNGPWTSEGIAIVFTPNQKLTPKIEWLVNDFPTGTGTNFTYSPSNNQEELKVKISYLDETGALIRTEPESIVVFNKLLPPVVNSVAGTGCAASTTLSVQDPIAGVTYEWYSDDPTFYFLGVAMNTPKSGTYFVKANGCAQSAPITIVQTSDITPPTFTDNKIFYECDNLGQSSKDYNLSSLVSYPSGSGYTLEFLDATTNVVVANAANGYMLPVTSGIKRDLKIKISSTTTSCVVIKSFSVYYLSLPMVGTVYTPSSKLCAGANSYSTTQFKNEFFPSSGYTIKFSTNNVDYNLDTVNPSLHNSVSVKITHPDFTCESIVNLNFHLHPEVEIRPFTPFPDHCSSPTEYFDLNRTKRELEYSTDIKATFYKDPALSDRITNLNYRGSGTVYIKIENTTTGCVALSIPTLHLTVYSKPDLVKLTPETKFSNCGTTIYDLTTNINDYIRAWTRYSEIRYYRANGTKLTQTEWENYNPNTSDASGVFGQPYMIFVYNETDNLDCSHTIQFDLIERTIPSSSVSQISTCGATTYSLQNFKDAVIANSSQYTFYESDGITEMTTDFSWTSFPHQVQYFIKNNTTGCLSSLQTVDFIVGTSTPILKNNHQYTVCDTDFDGRTTFSLDSVKNQFTNDTSATFECFKDAALTQSIPANYTNETAYNQTVYARIKSAGYCPVVVTIDLKANIPTKSSTLQDKYFICFGDTVSIDAGAENIEWEWSDGQNTQVANFTAAGNYSVKLTNSDGCFYTHNFVISDENQPVIEQINQNESQIEVIATGLYPIEYSFDGGRTWQLSNIYPNPTKPEYEIQVRSVLPDGSYCLGEKSFIYTITVSNFISPNDDGRNDTWLIKNLDRMEEVEIIISDRYGKSVFHTTDINNLEWTGKLNGRTLSTGTYWYVVKWFDAARKKSEIRQGWILLKNRN